MTHPNTARAVQVALVEITRHGSDLALFLDGYYIISADPGAGDPVAVVEAVGEGLAQYHGVDLERIEYPAHEDWQWHEIENDLKARRCLVSLPLDAACVS